DQRRLYQRSPSHTFFSYKDAYGALPFAYFSSNGGPLGGYKDTDCTSLGVAPYFQGWSFAQQRAVPYDPNNPANKKYHNENKFQIVSGGRDQLFGPGGEWNPSAPNVPRAGRDDQSNFHAYNLGDANQ